MFALRMDPRGRYFRKLVPRLGQALLHKITASSQTAISRGFRKTSEAKMHIQCQLRRRGEKSSQLQEPCHRGFDLVTSLLSHGAGKLVLGTGTVPGGRWGTIAYGANQLTRRT
jgi:hypothetical protein